MTRLTEQDKPLFDAALFWADKPIKKYVVTLFCHHSGKTNIEILAASCSDRASEIAIQNTLLPDAVVREIRLATPEDLGCEPIPAHDRASDIAKASGLTKFSLPGMAGNMYLLGNAPAMAAVQLLQQQHQRLSAALADCLAMMQRAEQHQSNPRLWANPINVAAWDVATTAGHLVLKEAVCQ